MIADVRRTAEMIQYHSPERLRDGQLSPADDTWGVAGTLFSVLTTARPFGELQQEILARLPHGPPSLAAYRIQDEALNAILAAALSPDPSRRIGHVTHLRQHLERWFNDPAVFQLKALEDEETGEEDAAATAMMNQIFDDPRMSAPDSNIFAPPSFVQSQGGRPVPSSQVATTRQPPRADRGRCRLNLLRRRRPRSANRTRLSCVSCRRTSWRWPRARQAAPTLRPLRTTRTRTQAGRPGSGTPPTSRRPCRTHASRSLPPRRRRDLRRACSPPRHRSRRGRPRRDRPRDGRPAQSGRRSSASVCRRCRCHPSRRSRRRRPSRPARRGRRAQASRLRRRRFRPHRHRVIRTRFGRSCTRSRRA